MRDRPFAVDFRGWVFQLQPFLFDIHRNAGFRDIEISGPKDALDKQASKAGMAVVVVEVAEGAAKAAAAIGTLECPSDRLRSAFDLDLE